MEPNKKENMPQAIPHLQKGQPYLPRVIGAGFIGALLQISGLVLSCLFGTAYTLARHKTAMTSRALFPLFS